MKEDRGGEEREGKERGNSKLTGTALLSVLSELPAGLGPASCSLSLLGGHCLPLSFFITACHWVLFQTMVKMECALVLPSPATMPAQSAVCTQASTVKQSQAQQVGLHCSPLWPA